MKSDALRKAAILVASLDAAAADALLDQMDPEEASLVRNAVMDLGAIDAQEQQSIIQDFVSGGRSEAQDMPGDEAQGVELDPSLVAKINQGVEPEQRLESKLSAHSEPEPFQCLHGVDVDELANVLVREHPQTTAIVVGHLSPSRAAAVLRRLPDALQTEALTRIARLTAPDREVIRDVEQEMQSLLAHRRDQDPPVSTGLAAVEAILQATSDDERNEWVAKLMESDQRLAKDLCGGDCPRAISTPARRESSAAAGLAGSVSGTYPDPQAANRTATPVQTTDPGKQLGSFTFADLEKLDDAALAQVLHASSPNTTLLALTGASRHFVKRILAQLPGREAGQLERKMQQLGPIRLDDVERAQWRLADLAQRLIDEGTITASSQGRFAAAA